jgi:hypothetical protein
VQEKIKRQADFRDGYAKVRELCWRTNRAGNRPRACRVRRERKLFTRGGRLFISADPAVKSESGLTAISVLIASALAR